MAMLLRKAHNLLAAMKRHTLSTSSEMVKELNICYTTHLSTSSEMVKELNHPNACADVLDT